MGEQHESKMNTNFGLNLRQKEVLLSSDKIKKLKTVSEHGKLR